MDSSASSAPHSARSVVVVQDTFTSYFEPQLMLDLVDLLVHLGFTPWLAPLQPNGKPLHVHGFLGAFGRIAGRNAAMLRALAAENVPLVGLDPSMTLGAVEVSPLEMAQAYAPLSNGGFLARAYGIERIRTAKGRCSTTTTSTSPSRPR